MFTTTIEIIVVILAVTIALLSLIIGGYPSMLRVFYYLRFPPARFYLNAMRAIDKLEVLREKQTDSVGKELKVGSVKLGDIGFTELVRILEENKMVKGEAQEIMLVEDNAFIGIGNISPQIVRFLVVWKGGEQEILRTSPFDPTKPIRELRGWAEEITRKRVANWILAIVGLFLVASIYLTLTT